MDMIAGNQKGCNMFLPEYGFVVNRSMAFFPHVQRTCSTSHQMKHLSNLTSFGPCLGHIQLQINLAVGIPAWLCISLSKTICLNKKISIKHNKGC